MTVVARTTVHAAVRKAGAPPKFVNVFALNEWDPKASGVPDYRKTFETQRSSLLATEMKNNAARLAKYTITVRAGAAGGMGKGCSGRRRAVLSGPASAPPFHAAPPLAAPPHPSPLPPCSRCCRARTP
jgi:hypothetical protein